MRGKHPVFPGCFYEVEGSDDIGFYEGLGTFDGIVNMAFGCKMDDALDIVLAEETVNKRLITDISFDEGMGGHTLTFLKVIHTAGIGKPVKVDDMVIRILPGKVTNKVGANEAGSPGNEDAFHQPAPFPWTVCLGCTS